MTKITSISTLVLLIFVSSVFSQDSIPNPDFENWTSNTSPKHWQSTNNLLPPGYITCYRTTNNYLGDYAAQLKTIELDGFPVPGLLTLGEVGMGYTEGGIGFTGKPVSLKGFFRHPSVGDQVMVIVQFFKNGNQIGSAFWSTSDSVPVYTEFNAPISFQSTENPDTLNITILTDQNIVGSSISIDALQFEYTTTSTFENQQGRLKVYPNPCSNQLIMNLPQGIRYEVRIFDMKGNRMPCKSDQNHKRIDTSKLPKGSYSLIVISQLSVYKEKIIKE